MTKKEKIKWVNSLMEDIGMTYLGSTCNYVSLVWDEDNKRTYAIKYNKKGTPIVVNFTDLPKNEMDLIIADLKQEFD